MNPPVQIVLTIDPTPLPIEALCEKWNKKPSTLRAWCEKDLIPGAYKQPTGEQQEGKEQPYQWFFSPVILATSNFDPKQLESISHLNGPTAENPTQGQGGRDRPQGSGRQVQSKEKNPWDRRVRSPKRNLRAS